MDAEVKISSVQEAVRHHDDRLAYLENRHGSLSAHHDLKQAVHAATSIMWQARVARRGSQAGQQVGPAGPRHQPGQPRRQDLVRQQPDPSPYNWYDRLQRPVELS